MAVTVPSLRLVNSCPIELDQLSVLMLTLVEEVEEPLLQDKNREVAAIPFESDVFKVIELFRPMVSPAIGESESVGD